MFGSSTMRRLLAAVNEPAPRFEDLIARSSLPYGTSRLTTQTPPTPPLPAERQLGHVGAQLQGTGAALSNSEAALIERARATLRDRLSQAHARREPPADYQSYLHLLIADQPRERLVVLFLGRHDELIGEDVMFSGDVGQVPVFIPEIIRAAFERRADGVIVSHNHPSGPALPSDADTRCVAALKKALEAVGLRYVDDIIVSRTATYSHRETGTL